MAVPTAITDLSATLASNSPAGGDTVFPELDNYLRAAFGFIRQGDAKASDVASATTTDIGAAAGRIVDVTGTTTITGFGTVAAGVWRIVRFTGALTLTHNATSLILPGSANITTTAGDCAIAVSLGSGNWVVTHYQVKGAVPSIIASGTYTPTGTASTNVTTVTPSTCVYSRVGSVVTVSGVVAVTQTSATGTTVFYLTFPISSASTSANDAAGVFATTGDGSGAQAAGRIYSDHTNDRFAFTYIGSTTGTGPFSFSFTAQYLIV